MYSKIRTFRTTQQQYDTLKTMKSYNMDVSRFIRDAIREKILRDKPIIKPISSVKSESTRIITQIEQIINRD